MKATTTFSTRRGELIAAVVLIALSGWIVWAALRMPLGSGAAPGPGDLPAALGCLLLAVSVGLLVRALRLSGDQAHESVALGHSHIWLVLLALLVVAFAFEPLGYLVTMTLFLTALLRRFSARGWLSSALISLIIAFATYYFFDTLLGVVLPAGVLRLS